MRPLLTAATVALSSIFPLKAHSYPIDCAILLCLSGGWPASAPCSAARAEFIRRITPFPVEPPLQIWRCPMGGAELTPPRSLPRQTHAASDWWPEQVSPVAAPLRARKQALMPLLSVLLSSDLTASEEETVFKVSADVWADPFAELRRERYGEKSADIDISGPEFDFVRSIRVFQTYAYQRVSGRDDDECTSRSAVLLGSYGTQGEFSWKTARLSDLPEAHNMPDGMGTHCPSIFHRSVFVEWRDYEENYGFEQVNY